MPSSTPSVQPRFALVIALTVLFSRFLASDEFTLGDDASLVQLKAPTVTPTVTPTVMPTVTPTQGSSWLDLTGMEALQSSTGSGSGGVASRAIDGNSNSEWSGGSCTHTSTEAQPFWRVDLGQPKRIEGVRVTNRGDCCGDRLNGFDVSVDGNGCASNVQIAQGETKEVQCTAIGQILQIALSSSSGTLTLCEVGVLGQASQADHTAEGRRRKHDAKDGDVATTLERMRWWQEGDAEKSPTDRYLVFRPDVAGPNNVRIGVEMVGVVAGATNRTFVLPPSWKIDHLDYGFRSFAKEFKQETTTRVEDLLNLQQLKTHLPTLTWEEFTERTGIATLEAAEEKATQVETPCHLPSYRAVDAAILFMGGKHDREGGLKCGEWAKLGGPVGHFQADFGVFEWSLLTHAFSWHKDAFDIASKLITSLGIFEYSALHARYGDFSKQYKEALQAPEEMFERVGKLFEGQGRKVYLATDDPEQFGTILGRRRRHQSNHNVSHRLDRIHTHKQWRNALIADLRRHNLDVVMFGDVFNGELKDVRAQYDEERWRKLSGLVEELICTFARVFVGSPKSTFTGHIQRMRIHAKAPVTALLFHLGTDLDIKEIEKEEHAWADHTSEDFRRPNSKGDVFLNFLSP